MKRLFTLLSLFVLTGPWAQTLTQSDISVTPGPVSAIARSGNTLYLGGNFSYAGYNTPAGVVIDATTGLPKKPFPQFNNVVRVAIADGQGGWYVGGEFTLVGIVPRNRLAHLKSDGSLDMDWNPNVNGGAVYSLALSNAIVYAGGNFTTVGGLIRNRIAAIDATSGIVTAWNPSANSTVSALAAYGGVIYAGGNFTSIGGLTRNFLAALDVTTGNATSFNASVSSSVSAIAVNNGLLYIGGAFAAVGGTTRSRLAAIVPATGAATSWNPTALGTINTIAISNNIIYAGGSFTSVGGQIRTNIAAIDASGSVTSWNPSANNLIYSLAISGNKVYAGGTFTTIGGQIRARIAALDATTGLATSWDPNASQYVATVAIGDNNVFAGGNFTSIGGKARNRLAAFDMSTGVLTSWDPNANNTVTALVSDGTTVYAGGNFTTIGTATRNGIAAIDASTGLANSWEANANGNVTTLALDGSTLYAGGSFATIGGQARANIAALDASSGNATAWKPDANGAVSSITVSGSMVYAGGSFTSIGGQNRNRIAALDASSGNATPWDPNANGPVSTIAVNGGTVYAGGGFTTIGGQSRNRLAALEANTANATGWDPNANSTVASLAIKGNTVYAGGTFTTIGGQNRNRLAGIDISSGAASSWDPNLNAPVFVLNITGDTLAVGGSFSNVLTGFRTYFAEFTLPATGSSVTDHFRTITSGNWSDAATWQSSATSDFSSGVVSPATLSPDFNANAITISSNHTVTLNDQRTIDQTTISGRLLVAPNAVLTVNDGTGTDVNVASGGSLVLQSAAAGTASVGQLPAGVTISGNVTVERYFSNRRAWRLVTAPLNNANTIYEAWQNSKANEPGIGTFITGPAGANGLDAAKSYSLKVYDFSSQNLVNVAATNTSVRSNLINYPTRGYFLFIRGDRNPANLTPPNSNATTLSATGNLLTGDQQFIGAGDGGNFALVGNPYAAPVDFRNLTRNNVANRFYVWDPTLNTAGGYVLFDDVLNTGTYLTAQSTDLTTAIQSGQAFFAQVSATGSASITFTESSKTTETSNAAFRGANAANLLRTDLFVKNANDTATYVDGAVVDFDNSYQHAVTMEDAVKLDNINENLAIVRANRALALERRPQISSNDTIFLRLWNTTAKEYQFTFSPANFSTELTAILEDTYLNTSTPVSLTETTTINFAITANTASADQDRFRVVFKAAKALPITFTNIKAVEKNAGIQINWTIASERNTRSYIVEKSADGITYNQVSELTPKANNGSQVSYDFFDINAVKGNNYYRIKTISISGEPKFSQVVIVNIGNLKSSITANPNPVTNGVMNLQFVNQPKSRYTLQLFSKNGQCLLENSVEHQGGSASQTLILPTTLARGTYQLKISNGKSVTMQQVVLQ